MYDSSSTVGRSRRISRGRILAVAALVVAAVFAMTATAHAAVISSWSSMQPVGTVGANIPVSIRGTAPTSIDPLVASTAKLYLDGVLIPRASYTASIAKTSAYFYWSPSPALADGAHTFKVEVSDSAGRLSSKQWTATIAQAPTAVWLSPNAGSSVTTGRPTIGMSLSDNTPGTTFTVDGQVHSGSALGPVVATFGGSGLPGASAAFAPSVNLPLGACFLTATVTDAGGNARFLLGTAARGFITTAPPAMTELTNCDSCHPTYRSAHPTRANVSCTMCHFGFDGAHMQGTEECYDCHTQGWHNDKQKLTVTVRSACTSCHGGARVEVVQHTTASVEPSHVGSCDGCHVESIVARHAMTPEGATYAYQCDLCHSSSDPRVQAAVAAGNTSCSACHTVDHQAVHNVTIAESCSGADCHDGTNLTTLHSGTCGSCHESAEPLVVAAIAAGSLACESCHINPDHESLHQVTAPDCTGCHPGTSLTPIHAAPGCEGCHKSLDPAVVAAIAGHNRGCTACHDISHSFTQHTSHTVAGPCIGSNCHVADAKAIHGGPTGPSCKACHGTGVTATFSCGACHSSPHADENHGSTDSCTSCHQTGNLMGVHGDNCAKCHPTPAQGVTYVGGCQQTGCHPGVHADVAGHNTGHGDGDDCWSCHPSDGGNCDYCHAPVYERAKPITTSNARASYTAAAVIRLTAVDQGEWGWASGVRATYYQIDGGPLQTGVTVTVPGPATGTAKHSVEFWSQDNQDNTEAHHVVYFQVAAGVDAAPPTGTMSLNNGAEWTNSTVVTVNSAVTDAETGIAAIRVDPATGTFGAWTDFSDALAITIPAGNGVKTVRVEYKDGGNNVLAASDTIALDAVTPTGTFAVNGGGYATNLAAVTLNSSVTDAYSGLTQMRFMDNYTWTWSAWEPYSASRGWTLYSLGNGTRWMYAQYMDAAGNVLPLSDSIIYDATPPTATFSVNNGAPSTTSVNVTLNYTASDSPAGLNQMRFSNDNTNWSTWETYAASKAWVLSTGDGLKTVYAQFSDKAGNVRAVSDTINLGNSGDSTPPTGSVVINSGADFTSTLNATLTLSASDIGGSGVFDMCFSTDNVTWSTWEPYATSKAFTLASTGTSKTVYVRYRDGASNISNTTISDTITFDNIRPTGSVNINGGATYAGSQSVTLSVGASDGMGGSGVTHMQFSDDGATWSAWEPFAATKAWTLPAGAGVKWVYVQVRDAAGNVSVSSSDSIGYLLSSAVTYAADANGTISGASSQTVNYGMSGSAVTAVANSGYHFTGWSDGRTDNPRTDSNVTSTISVTALFGLNGTYSVRFITDGSGSISGNLTQSVLPGGSTTAVTASAYDPASYDFNCWYDGNNTWLYTNPLVLTNVTSDQTWTAYFTYTGSCPFLYTWDGTAFRFEADEFAAGKLALQTSKGYRRPNPLDYHVLATTPAVKDGALEYKLVEERDEVDYLDKAALYAVDAPADRDIYVERSQAEGVGQFTTLNAVIHTTAKNLQPPPSVTWINTGEDVRAKLAASDENYVVLNQDRNVGFNYQTLELDLGDVKDAPQAKLVIDGRTMIPTSPEGRTYSRNFGPQVKFEVQDAAGNWLAVPTTNTILPKPPEFRRPFVLDLSRIWISDSRKVRLTYLYKTYIDSILLDTTADVPVTLTELPLMSADLQPHGFNFRKGVGELYDYVYGVAFSAPRYMLPGNYTRFGAIDPLVGAIDDKFVIFGGGDELTLRFAPPATSADGLTRRYLFLSDGYYKDLKENVSHTVDPLPFAAMSNFPYPASESYPTDADHQAYLSEWNTRYEGE